ncbi:MAG: sensor histidine kinase, partial [Myxococcales bacterium]
GQLAAGVAHEINNPLTTITMYAEALISKLTRPGVDSTDLDKAKRIQEAADRILKFARELTSYARPARDRPEVVQVHELLEQALTYCEHSLRTAGVQVERAFADDVTSLKAVRTNLVQVFVNLVTNACHAMPETGGRIRLLTRRSNGGVEIHVADNGAGITEKNLSKIFEPFFTTKAEGKGTGLGLPIVQGIVANHGGTISVKSEIGAGTTFVVWLPDAA